MTADKPMSAEELAEMLRHVEALAGYKAGNDFQAIAQLHAAEFHLTEVLVTMRRAPAFVAALIAQVKADERERCAKIAENEELSSHNVTNTVRAIAAAIREGKP